MCKRLQLFVSVPEPDVNASANSMEILRSIVPEYGAGQVRWVRADSHNKAGEAVGRELAQVQPSSVVTVTNTRDAVYQTFRYLAHRYDKKLAVLWIDSGPGSRSWNSAVNALCCDPLDKHIVSFSKDRLFRVWHTAKGWRVASQDVTASESSMSPKRCADLLQAERIRYLAVRLGFTAVALSSVLLGDSIIHELEETSQSFVSLQTISRMVSENFGKYQITGTCIVDELGAAVDGARHQLAQDFLFRQCDSHDDDVTDGGISHWSTLDVAEVVAGWLIDGRSCRTLDTWVLGLDGSETNGAQSAAILKKFGIAEKQFRGMLHSADFDSAGSKLHNASRIADLLRSVRPDILSKPVSTVKTDPPYSSEYTAVLPELKRSERRREYDKYSPAQRRDVVYNFLFNGAHHRELDESVLKLDPDWSKGFQSMGILHFLGLKAEYRGYFIGQTVRDAIEQMQRQTNASAFRPIIELLEQLI